MLRMRIQKNVGDAVGLLQPPQRDRDPVGPLQHRTQLPQAGAVGGEEDGALAPPAGLGVGEVHGAPFCIEI